jgi:hypothetical protein
MPRVELPMKTDIVNWDALKGYRVGIIYYNLLILQ